MTTFNQKFAAAMKSYKNNAKNISLLVADAIEYAAENNHNPVYLNKLLAGMIGSNDQADMALIITTLAPFHVKDGVAKLASKKVGREYAARPDMNVSFRSLADSLRGEKKAATYVLETRATAFVKAAHKNDVTREELFAAYLKAEVAIYGEIVEDAPATAPAVELVA